jgi:DNA-binding CsgD family transcriptional regulator
VALVGAGATARRQLVELATGTLVPNEFGEAVASALRTLVPFDGYALIAVNPMSGLRSMMLSRNGVGPAAALARNEFVTMDINRYSDLARRQVPAGILSAGDPRDARSPRLRTILQPAGYLSELRLVLRSGHEVWGALVLFRSENLRAFTDSDAAALATLGDALSHAVRKFCVRPPSEALEPLDSGTMVLEDDDSIAALTTSAHRWVDELRAGSPNEVTAADALRIPFEAGHAARATGHPVSVCLRGMSGRWMTLVADRLEGEPRRTAVTFAPATATQITPSFGKWHGLTAREHAVVTHVVEGEPAKVIAHRLGISRYTVEDHLKSIYRKVEADGRDSLLARLSTGS